MRSISAIILSLPLLLTQRGGYAVLAPTSVTSYVLDTLSVSPVAAYSVRKLRAGYSGNAMQVKRSSDSTTSNIGFTGTGDLDTTTLASFCSATTCSVVTWYDQSGNGRDQTQSTVATQPVVVSSGTIVTANSKTSLSFSGSQYFGSTSGFPGTTDFTMNAVSLSSGGAQIIIGSATTFTCALWYGASTSTGVWLGSGVSSATVTAGAYNIATGTYVRSSTTAASYANGTAGTTGTGSAGSDTTFQIGAVTSGYAINGKIGEALVFGSVLSTTDRQKLEHSQEAYFSISGV